MPLEPHCAVADWQPHQLTLWCSTQSIYGVRSDLAATFGLELDQVRVLCEYMGGGFGAKISAGESGMLATELSRRSGRPVRLVLTRRDENLVSGFRTPVDMTFVLGASSDGTLTADRGLGDHGARHRRLALPRARAPPSPCTSAQTCTRWWCPSARTSAPRRRFAPPA